MSDGITQQFEQGQQERRAYPLGCASGAGTTKTLSPTLTTTPKPAPRLAIEERQCSRCRETKAADEFHLCHTNKNRGLQYYCKDCRAERDREGQPERTRPLTLVQQLRARNAATWTDRPLTLAIPTSGAGYQEREEPPITR